jgi:hypothetical protein
MILQGKATIFRDTVRAVKSRNAGFSRAITDKQSGI